MPRGITIDSTMKKHLAALAIAAFTLPFIVSADDGASAPQPGTLSATVSVRIGGSLLWSGAVSLPQGQASSASDDSGNPHPLVSDSALAALIAADALSPDFEVTSLRYYSSFGSFYLNCVTAQPYGQACDKWQYVVNSQYPPEGADHYTLADGDTVYFYFGTPRRVTLSTKFLEAGSALSVLAESYDYTSDAWRPLSGATLGMTQQNPNDPYSPLVWAQAATNSSGQATFSTTTVGSYGIGFAQDWFADSDTFEIIPKNMGTAGGLVSAQTASSYPDTSSGRKKPLAATLFQITEGTDAPAAAHAPASSVAASGESVITFNIPADTFKERFAAAYKEALNVTSKIVYSSTASSSVAAQNPALTQTASAQNGGSWLDKVFNLLGF